MLLTKLLTIGAALVSATFATATTDDLITPTVIASSVASATLATSADINSASTRSDNSIDKRNVAACYPGGDAQDVTPVSRALTAYCYWASSWVLGAGGFVTQTYNGSGGVIEFEVKYLGGAGTNILISEADCLMNDCPAGSDMKLGGIIQDDTPTQYTMAVGQPPLTLRKERSLDKRDLTCNSGPPYAPIDVGICSQDLTIFCAQYAGTVLGGGGGGYVIAQFLLPVYYQFDIGVTNLGGFGLSVVIEEATCLTNMEIIMNQCQAYSDQKTGGSLTDAVSTRWWWGAAQLGAQSKRSVSPLAPSTVEFGNNTIPPPAKEAVGKRDYTIGCDNDSPTFNVYVADTDIINFCAFANGKKITASTSVHSYTDNISFEINYLGTSGHVKVSQQACRDNLAQVKIRCQNQGTLDDVSGTSVDGDMMYSMGTPLTDKKRDVAVAKRDPGPISCWTDGYAVDLVTFVTSIQDFCQSVAGTALKPGTHVAQEWGNAEGHVFLEIAYTGGTWAFTIEETYCVSTMQNLANQCPLQGQKLGGWVSGLDDSVFYLWTGQPITKRSPTDDLELLWTSSPSKRSARVERRRGLSAPVS
ncbi:hypothetical protein LTR85_002266 [Meristemomyces frigidus]|nr:hypothetical protein LTR85_002266 [Meristemomyces frigidus]